MKKSFLKIARFSLAVPISAAIAIALFAGQNTAQSAESFEEIVASAQAESKPIVLEFTGSDWCPPCKMMHKEVFGTEAFQKFAEENLVFVKVDFPKRKELPAEEAQRNESLAKQFDVRGFPTVVILNSDGKEVAREVGFQSGGVSSFIAWVKKQAAL